jgi:D-arabinose 1-dehydrogenase-like Zn-dependent alcohol dehydrogenase
MKMSIGREIHGYAAVTEGAELTSFTYKSRDLGEDDIEIKITHCGICGTGKLFMKLYTCLIGSI